MYKRSAFDFDIPIIEDIFLCIRVTSDERLAWPHLERLYFSTILFIFQFIELFERREIVVTDKILCTFLKPFYVKIFLSAKEWYISLTLLSVGQ